MTVMHSFTSGLRRVLGSPALIFWLFFAGLVIALPLTAAMRDILKASIGSSLVDQNLRRTFDLDWYGEFRANASGLSETFSPAVVGILPVLHDLERLVNGEILSVNRVVLAAGILFLFAWAFFGGGIITRYARPDEPRNRADFFSVSARFFFRYLRLLVLSLLVYWAVFRWVAGPLHTLMDRLMRDITVEFAVLLYTVLYYLVILFLLMLGSMAMDYAKISMVIEDRHSAVLAFFHGLRFVFARPLRTSGLYLLLALVGLALLLAYGVVAPGAGQSRDLTLIVAFLISQLFLLARLILRLWFLASQTVLYQSATEVRQAEAPPAPAPVPVAP